MNKIIVLCIFFVFLLKPAICQSLLIPDKGFQASVSLGNTQYKEYLFNGLRNDGINYSLQVDYNIVNNKITHNFGFNLTHAFLWNRYGWPNWFINPSLHYRFLIDINSRFKFGGNIRYSNLFYSNENYDSQHLYWITPADISASAVYYIPLKNGAKLIIPVNIPLFGFLSRPPADRNLILNEPDLKVSDILKRLNSDFNFYTIGNKLFEIETGVYFQTINNLTFGYRLHYQQTALSKNTQLFTNQFVFQFPMSKLKK